jgi:hypothetical protein
MTSTEEQLTGLNGEWKNNGLTWSEFGDFSEENIANVEKEWFPNCGVRRGQLHSVWKRHPGRQQGNLCCHILFFHSFCVESVTLI